MRLPLASPDLPGRWVTPVRVAAQTVRQHRFCAPSPGCRALTSRGNGCPTPGPAVNPQVRRQGVVGVIPSGAARQTGLTLIELMVAVALGLLLVAALGFLYAGQRQSWRTLEAVARLQENGRFALEVLGRDLRMAGYAGCISLSGTSTTLLAKLEDTAKDGHFRSLLTPFLQAQGQVVRGYVNWGVDRNMDGTVNNADRPGDTSYVPSDTLLVVGGTTPVLSPTAVMGSKTADIPLTGNTRAFRQGELALIADCDRVDVFRVSNDNTAYTTGGAGGTPIQHTTALPHQAQRNTSSEIYKAYGPEAMVMPLGLNVYYLRRRVSGALPSLYRLSWASDGQGWGSSEELIEGVEDMRIVYGVDTSPTPDGTVDEYRTAAGVADWSRVRAVRVSLLLVSTVDGVAAAPQTYVWDTDNDGELDDTVTASDRRLRMVFTSTYALRNRP